MASKRLITLSPKELRAFLTSRQERDFLLIDVRQPQEYTDSHIPGSQLIPLPELERRIFELPENRDLVFYCRSGSRSAAAGLLALEAESSGKAVYHLGGGLLGWDGKTLSDFPRVQVFRDLDSPAQFLEKAMALEKGAWLFYRTILSDIPESPLTGTLEKLAAAETGHAKTVYRHMENLDASVPPFDVMFETLPGTILENGEPMEEAVARLSADRAPSELRIIEIALDIEYAAFDLYRNMAEDEDAKEASNAFYALAQAEKSHMRLLTEALV